MDKEQSASSTSNPNKKKESAWFKTKKTFFGVSKEFKRITWPTFKHILWGFFVVFVMTALLVLIFYIVKDVMIASHVINVVKTAASSSSSSASNAFRMLLSSIGRN